ncbi:MAG TPA: sigma-70 family RNA polymerase sigma factor [Gaiellaceae bacterium]
MDAVGEEIERLYRARYSGFRHAVAGIVGDYDEAHDVVQDGFARAFAERRQFRSGSLPGWVWQIVMRRALDARRRRRPGALEDEIELDFLGSDRDPELVAALLGLPPRRRLIVFLRYFADLSYEEIAVACGLSVGTVSATLAQALASLRLALGALEVSR